MWAVNSELPFNLPLISIVDIRGKVPNETEGNTTVRWQQIRKKLRGSTDKNLYIATHAGVKYRQVWISPV